MGYVYICHLIGKYSQRHGRNYLLLFFISFFISPIMGFIIAALMGESEEYRYERIKKETEYRVQIENQIRKQIENNSKQPLSNNLEQTNEYLGRQRPENQKEIKKTHNSIKIALYVHLILYAMCVLSRFIYKFSFLNIYLIMEIIAILIIIVISIIRMIKNENFAFLTIAFFAISTILTFFTAIHSGFYGLVFTFIAGIVGFILSLLNTTTIENLYDVNSYKRLLHDATRLDYVLLGVYTFFSFILLLFQYRF